MVRLACLGAGLALAAGCGGDSIPDGTPIAVRFDVVERAGPYGPHGPTPQPLTVHETNAEWARVSRLLPDPLPERIGQGSDCVSGYMVSVRLSTKTAFAGEVNYGPCRWPEQITPVRLLLQTLLRRRLAVELKSRGPNTEGSVDVDQHTELEQRLVKSGLTVCNGGCREFRRTHAACTRVEAELNGRALYRCRVQSEEVGGGEQPGPEETICAALGRIGDRGYDARPLADCR